ncbi:MAG TPA: PepSY domain-containing protein [Alphaproteobacteria bacterium]|jgi:uncharacterized iron-regulated membrane protein|nr:PepSY domain-containing protein [Alphaproteobacteria bacterium]
MMADTTKGSAARSAALYRMIWRWHFYAGLFCIPFVLWLAVTGSIYLFKPQIEALIDRPYDHLTITDRQLPSAQVRAAMTALPEASLQSVELPATETGATRVILNDRGVATRVYVHPDTLAILKIVPEDDRLMNIVFNLHGELLMGNTGSIIIELAASWAIVMIVTGLYLWWPRNAAGLGGIVYPRLGGQGRLFWRDLHAVIGLWVSFFTLFILLSGLPWAKSWGAYLQEIRQITGTAVAKQDWPSGSPAAPPGTMQGMAGMPGMSMGGQYRPRIDGEALDRVVDTAIPLQLARPVLVSPPQSAGGDWSVKSDAQNRTLRSDVTVDGATGKVLTRVDFGQRQWVDRVVGVGVAAHEGHLFGWLNQLISLLTATGLIAVSISAGVMWWRRRSPRTLGAPQRIPNAAVSAGVMGIIILFAALLPLLAASLIAVLICERAVIPRFPAMRRWLGLG